MNIKKQVNVRFDGRTLEQLEELERKTGKSISDILRNAVNQTHWLTQEQAQGSRVLLERREGNESKLRELVFPI